MNDERVLAKVRVSVDLGRFAVRSPARVSDRDALAARAKAL